MQVSIWWVVAALVAGFGGGIWFNVWMCGQPKAEAEANKRYSGHRSLPVDDPVNEDAAKARARGGKNL